MHTLVCANKEPPNQLLGAILKIPPLLALVEEEGAGNSAHTGGTPPRGAKQSPKIRVSNNVGDVACNALIK